MSAVTITITLPPESQALIQRFEQMPQELPRAIKRGMDTALPIVADRIRRLRLTGIGPFPPILHRLGEVSQSLIRSVRAEPAVISGNTVTGAIGSNVTHKGVNYARVHEFGASFFRRTDVLTRRVVIPERAPFRTGIKENAEYISQEIQTEIETTLNRK